MVRLLGASALALVLTAPAAQAAYRHPHAAFTGYRQHSVVRFASVRHRVVYRRPGSGAARGEAVASHDEMTGRWYRERSEHFAERRTFATTRVSGGRPRAWCGWYARSLVGSDPGPTYNLARNWAHWGRSASPGVGVMVVWLHHVGMITDARWPLDRQERQRRRWRGPRAAAIDCGRDRVPGRLMSVSVRWRMALRCRPPSCNSFRRARPGGFPRSAHPVAPPAPPGA
jgi:hypothetical protein